MGEGQKRQSQTMLGRPNMALPRSYAMTINRRNLLSSFTALVAAPAVIRVADLMPIKPWHDVSVYGMVDGELSMLGNYRIGDQIPNPGCFIVSPRSLEYIRSLVDGLPIWQRTLNLDTTGPLWGVWRSKYPTVSVRDTEPRPVATLYCPVGSSGLDA